MRSPFKRGCLGCAGCAQPGVATQHSHLPQQCVEAQEGGWHAIISRIVKTSTNVVHCAHCWALTILGSRLHQAVLQSAMNSWLKFAWESRLHRQHLDKTAPFSCHWPCRCVTTGCVAVSPEEGSLSAKLYPCCWLVVCTGAHPASWTECAGPETWHLTPGQVRHAMRSAQVLYTVVLRRCAVCGAVQAYKYAAPSVAPVCLLPLRSTAVPGLRDGQCHCGLLGCHCHCLHHWRVLSTCIYRASCGTLLFSAFP